MPVTFDSEAPVKARLAIAEVGFGQGARIPNNHAVVGRAAHGQSLNKALGFSKVILNKIILLLRQMNLEGIMI